VKTVNVTPNWQTTAEMLLVIIESGVPESQAFAKSEIIRMGKIIDQLQRRPATTVAYHTGGASE